MEFTADTGDRTRGGDAIFFLVFVAADLIVFFFRRTDLGLGITSICVTSGITFSVSTPGTPRYCNKDGVAGSSGKNGAIAFSVIVCGFFFGNFGFFI